MIIAVDGPTASGKGTIARALAEEFGLPHLDTGLLYRAVGRQAVISDFNPDDPVEALCACGFPDELLNDPELRTEETGGLASRVSVHPGVREALYERQRSFALQEGGAVLDGRDIGTVIIPEEADAKLFVTASAAARASRRFREMQSNGVETTLEEITAQIEARDKRDEEREDSPLKPAEDAYVLDTTLMKKEEAISAAIRAVKRMVEDGAA
ncbi:(d)CMP kinase [Pseudoblastomonas halimionae]|uniref:Cytidylate kinase n=1 Tax=Alteriqipengyuania halimionae TaxID=1926630 RepID=A0A6I4U192_9SPHN|nr:(d)CMP kinase [Alteriqipengyuania halimionae]MXP09760.1 (d)CMP kinase [Alteriqipengyuania halimionae]